MNSRHSLASRWLLLLAANWILGSEVRAQSPVPVTVDGDLSDSLWQQVEATSMTPLEAGVPAALGGEVMCGVMGGYLYFGARLPEPTSRITARSIGVNPNWEEGEDQIED